MKKQQVAIVIGFLLLVAGLVFWLVSPNGYPPVPTQVAFSSLENWVELDEAATKNELTEGARKNSNDAITVIPTRVFACNPFTEVKVQKFSEYEYQKIIDRRDQERREIRESLVNSEDPEHLLVVALIGFDGFSKESLVVLERALAADPGNRLTLWNFLDACTLHTESNVCADGNIEKRAVLVDGNNGLLWGKIAVIRFDRGDAAAAYEALRKANTAPQFNDYFVEHVRMLERGFAAATDKTYQERMMDAFGEASMFSSHSTGLPRGCEKQAAQSMEWLQTCLEYGKRLEGDGTSMLSVLIGIELQKAMHEISGDAPKISETELRAQLTRNEILLMHSEDALVLLFKDDQVLTDYLEEWSAHGEWRALQFVQKEVVRLSQQPGYDPCILNKARESSTDD